MKTRINFLDNMRTFLIFLVIVLHAGIVYEPILQGKLVFKLICPLYSCLSDRESRREEDIRPSWENRGDVNGRTGQTAEEGT